MEEEERFSRLEAASLQAAESGLKALLLLNGGACIAVLGFLASTASQENISITYARIFSGMVSSLVFFSTGAGLAVLTSFFAYLANQCYASALLNPERYEWSLGTLMNRLGIACALLSLAFFALGVFKIWAGLP